MRVYALFLILGFWLLVAVEGFAAGPIFPKSIEFSVHKGIASGTFQVSFSDKPGIENFLVVLRNFGGFGMRSNQQLWSYLKKDDLSLVGHMLTENDQSSAWIREVRLETNCKSALGQGKTRCFKYRERGAGPAIQTEIFAPYPAIDLVSSLIVATRAAELGDSKEKLFNFIFNRVTKQVSLRQIGKEFIKTPLGKREVEVFILKLVNTSTELYRFYVGQDDHGHYPVKIAFTDENQETTELVASAVTW